MRNKLRVFIMELRKPTTLVTSIAIILFLSAVQSYAASRTWDGGGADTNWSTPANWDGDLTAPITGDALTFDGTLRLTNNNNLAADSVFGPITFAATAGSYVISGNRITLGGDFSDSSPNPQVFNPALVLSGNRTFSTDASTMLTLGGVISGSFGVTKSGAGTLVLGANNTYTGATVIDGGTLAYSVNQTALPALTFGIAPTTTSVSTNNGTLDLTNANVTTNSLTVQTNSSTANVITIGTGKTLTVNGPVAIGVSNVFTNTAAGANVVTNLNVAGDTLVMNTGTANLNIGLNRDNAASGTDPKTTVDLSGLNNFTFTATTGEFRVGEGNSQATLTLANVANTITTPGVQIGNSHVSGGQDNNGGRSVVHMGNGSNVINTATVTIGSGKSGGILDFATAATNGTLTLAGQTGGTSTANILIGSSTSVTGGNDDSELNLAGHNVTVQAGSIAVGQLAGGTAGNSGRGVMTFDTGLINVNSLQLAVNSTGTAPNGTTGTFTMGGPNPGNTAATGVLNVASQFFLANRTNTAAGAGKSTGSFVLNGGTANVATDILDASTTVSSAGANSTTLTVDGGTLNMMGHNIGTYAAPITTINLNSGTLNNAASIAGATINIQQAIAISGPTNYIIANGGTLTSSGLTLTSGGGIGGGGANGGNVSGDIVAGTGSQVTPGAPTVPATLQFNNSLSLNNNSTVTFKLSDNPSSGNDQITDSGNLTLTGTVNLSLVATAAGPQIGNKYTLFTYAGTLIGNQSNFAIQDPKTRETFTIVPTSTTPGTIQVSVGGSGPANLTWIGNNGNNWDLITTTNFRDASQTAQKFFNQDAVTFDNTSTNTNDVQVVGQLSPSAVTVNATRNYKFAGTGSLIGSGTLTKSGTGTLVIATNNTYSGGTTINTGTLQVGDGGTTGSLGTGPIDNEGTLIFNNSGTVTVPGVIAGSAGTIRQEGTGTLTLSGINTFSDNLTVNHGTVRLTAAGAAGSGLTTVNTGATLVVGGGQTGPITVTGGTVGSGFGTTQTTVTTADFTISPNTTATIYTADPQALATNGEFVLSGTGTLRGSGNINVLSGSNVASPDASTGFRLQGTNPSDYSGTITIGHNLKAELANSVTGPQSPAGTGKIVLTAGDAVLGGSLNASTLTGGYSEFNLRNNFAGGDTTFGNDVQITGTGLVLLNPLGTAPVGAAVNMGNLSIGTGQELGVYLASGNTHVINFQSVKLSGTARFSPQTPGFGATTAVGSDLALNSITETVLGSGVTMAGLRTLYLNGNSTYTGPTQVLSGTLGGTGSVTSTVTVNAGAAIAPGTSTTPIGSFTAPSVALSGTLKVDLNDFDLNVQDVLNVTGALSLSNAGVNFNVTGTSQQAAYVFAHYGTLTGSPFVSFTGIPDGYTINYNYQNSKEIALVPMTTPLKLGDFNFDGHVNGADVTAMLAALTDLNKFEANNTLTPARLLAVGDLDGSGAVNNADLQGLLTLLKSGGGSVAAVPEPPSACLLIIAVIVAGSASVLHRRCMC
jgi:autotransporter-associated beta strand protein